MLIGDWTMRLTWFRWQDSVIVGVASTEKGPYQPMTVATNPPQRGGDLTTLMGAVPGIDEFKDWKPAATNWTDEFGFRNRPPTEGRRYPVVVVGDSFMATGPRMEDTFAGCLSGLLGDPVYCYAFESRGPLWGIIRLLTTSGRFRERPPKLIVWGVLEREVSGAGFADAVGQVEKLRRQLAGAQKTYFDVSALSPRALKKSLPDTSAVAQLSSRLWNRIRFALFGRTAAVVVPADGLIAGRRLLFYGPGIEAMESSAAERDVTHVADTIRYFDELTQEEGGRLLVVLIPDKEEIYREHIPALPNLPDHPIPPSVLGDLDAALRARRVPVVNLLGPFREAASAGRLLYWTDDTHWNSDGIQMAVKLVLSDVEKLLERGAPVTPR